MFQQHQSVEGAYHEAMEAAAQRIQLASRSSETIMVNHSQHGSSSSSNDDNCEITTRVNSSGSGVWSTTATSSGTGYSSDVEGSSTGVGDSEYSNEKSMMNANDDIAVAAVDDEDPTSSVSSVSGSSKDDVSYSSGSGNDIDDDMDFLRQKQDILKRASQAMQREDAYMALKARAIVNGEMPYGSSLWSEAKTILEVLRNEKNLEKNKLVSPYPSTTTSIGEDNVGSKDVYEGNLQSLGQSTTSTDLEPHEYEFQVPTKRLKIDLSTVSKVSANMFAQPGNTAFSATTPTFPQAFSFSLSQELATSLFRAIG